MSSVVRRKVISRLPRAQRIADITAAARAVFCEKGYEAALTAEIADRAGIVEGTIYRYFSNKQDLLIKVIEAWYESLYDENERGLDAVRGTWNRLRFLIYRHLTFIHNDPAILRLLYNVLRAGPDYRSTSVFKLNQRYTQRVKAVIEEGVRKGELRQNVPYRIIRDMIFGGSEHYTFAYLRGEGDFSAEEAADVMTDLVFRALVKTSPTVADRGIADEDPVSRLERAVVRLESLAESS